MPLRVQIVTAEREVFAEEAMAVGGGFLQVARDQVLILADTAERADEVDEARAEESRRRAREALAESITAGQRIQAEAARVALRREEARIQVARRRRGPERHRPTPGPTAP